MALLPYIGSKPDIIGLVVKYQQVGHRTEILRLTICCIKHFKSCGIAVKMFFFFKSTMISKLLQTHKEMKFKMKRGPCENALDEDVG